MAIKGITVKIGADTKGLDKALKDIRSQSRKIGRELYQVNRALKFNPDSVELWAQKQDILTERVEQTKEKLDVLKQAEKDMQKQYKSGDVGEKKYREYRRELIKTEDQLSSFQDELEKTQRKATDFSRKMQKAADNMEKFGNKMKGIGQNLNQNVTLPLVASFTALTVGTRDFRKEISKLENNARTANVDMDEMHGYMSDLNAVTGELDSNVEGLSSLLAAGFRDEQLSSVIDDIAGAVIQFPDTLKFENLSESIQETIGSGQSVGQFDEMLSRLGINLDNFNDGLATAKENGRETDYVMQTLANTGLSDVYEQYRDNNEALVESAEANYDLQQSLADLGEELEPIMTDIVEGVTDAVDAFNDLSDEEKDMVIFGAGIVAALGPVLTITGNLSLTVSSLAGAIANAGGLNAALNGLAGALGPFAVGGAAAAGLAYMISGLADAKKQTDLLNQSIEDLSTMRELQEKLDAEFAEREKLQDLVNADGFMVDNSFAQERLDATNERIENILEKMNKINEKSESKEVEVKTKVKNGGGGDSGEKTPAQILQDEMSLFQAQMTLGEKNIDQYRNFLEEQFNSTEKYSKETRAMLKEELEKTNELYEKPEEFISNLFEEDGSSANLAAGLSQRYDFDENIAAQAAQAIQESLKAEKEAIAKLREEQSQYQEGTEIYQEYEDAIAAVQTKWETTTDIVRKYQNEQQKINEEARQQELEAEAEFQEEVYENKYEAGKVSLAEYIDYLKDKQSELRKWSDEWSTLNNKINNLEWELGFENETTTDFYGLYKFGQANDQEETGGDTKEQVQSINWMTDAFVDLGLEIEEANQKFVDWKDDLVTGLSDAIARGEDLGDVFDNIADQIASMVLQKAVVGPIVNYALGGLNLPTFHEGGFVSPANAIAKMQRYHEGGGIGLKSNEVPAILENGEYVLNKDQVKGLQNGGGSAPINIFDITAIDTQSFAEYVSRNPDAIINVVGRDIMRNGTLRQAIKKS